MGRLKHNPLAAVLSLLALVVLTAGVTSPFISMNNPLLGQENVYSLLGGIAALWRDGEGLLAGVLFVFSVCFPYAKLVTILAATNRHLPMAWHVRRRLHKLSVATGKYSLLDVLVVAVMILLVKFDDVADVSARTGTMLFCVAVLLSMAAGMLVDLSDAADAPGGLVSEADVS